MTATYALAIFLVLALLASQLRISEFIIARKYWWPLSCLVLCYFFCLVSWYLFFPAYFDHVEPNIAAVSWLWATGHPIYHALQSPERYSLLYGPLTYVVNGHVLHFFGPSITISKLAGIFSALATLVCMALTLRRHFAWRMSVFGTALLAATLLIFKYVAFWARPDPLLLLVVTASLWCIDGKAQFWKVLCAGVLCGIALNIKIHAVIYFLPLVVLLYDKQGWRRVAVCAGAAAVIFCLPFLFLHGVVWADYVRWLQQAAQHGLDPLELLGNLQWAIFFAAPLLLVTSVQRQDWSWRARDAQFVTALGASTLLMCVIAAKPGAGRHHLMPLLPLLVYAVMHNVKAAAVARSSHQNTQRIFSAWLLTLLIMVCAAQIESVTKILRNNPSGIADDLKNILHESAVEGKSVAMGFGGDYSRTFYRPLLVFAGQPYLLDASALMDMQKSGLAIPTATRAVMHDCAIHTWLIPKGGAPFDMMSNYTSTAPLFDAEFQRDFTAHYTRTRTTQFYDVWECQLP